MVDFKEWLEIRYLTDAKSRNQKILREFISKIQEFEALSIIDLGAGIGSNFRYLVERIDQDQNWIFVDKEIELLEYSTNYLSEKLHVDYLPGIKFERDDKLITIEIEQIDILNSKFLEIKGDCVVANAVFDLFSKEQFEDFIDSLSIPILYFTINYNGMKFVPSDETDEHYIKMYNEHMEREQDFGKAMASRCSVIMADVLNENNFDTVIGASDWTLEEEDKEVQLGLLRFMEDSIPELLNEDEVDDFNNWLHETENKINQGNLQIVVRHDDILAIKIKDDI